MINILCIVLLSFLFLFYISRALDTCEAVSRAPSPLVLTESWKAGREGTGGNESPPKRHTILLRGQWSLAKCQDPSGSRPQTPGPVLSHQPCHLLLTGCPVVQKEVGPVEHVSVNNNETGDNRALYCHARCSGTSEGMSLTTPLLLSLQQPPLDALSLSCLCSRAPWVQKCSENTYKMIGWIGVKGWPG